MIRKRQRSLGEYVEGDLEILPLMNLFVVLIPMLLISAVFVHLSVIPMNLPSDEAAQAAAERERLGLSVEIQEEVWVVKGRRLEARRIDRLGEQADDDLRAVLTAVKADHPSEEEVVIVSDPATRYDDIVEVMDASRESGLPNISLSGS